jgi:hypothetical protein
LADNRGVEAGAPSLLLFARAPREGRVKTRLEPALGPGGAARLYRAFLEDAARGYGLPCPWSPVLCADPDPDDPAFRDVFAPPWRLERQAAGDLGERLGAAFASEFRRGAPAVAAVGSDHPALPRRRLAEVFERLSDGAAACLIPAEDGGYCVIGLSRGVALDRAFAEIPWSSSRTLAATVERLSGAGVACTLLAPSYDVDRPEDLVRLADDLASRDPSDPDFPRATARMLASLPAGGAP